MKKIRLLVVAPTDEQLREATANLNPDDFEKSIPVIAGQLTLKYKAMIQTAMRTPLDRQGGVDIGEMEQSLKVLKLIDAAEDNGVLEMDDVDFDYLLRKINAVRWVGVDERIVVFYHTVKNATKDLLDDDPTST